MTSTSKPFQLVPPQQVVGSVEDSSDHVRSTMENSAQTKPSSILNVPSQRERAAAAYAPSQPQVELASSETLIEQEINEETSIYARPEYPRSAAHEIADLIGHTIPESGPDRQSFFSAYMEEYAKDSKSAIDVELMETLNKWFVSLTEATTTTETVIRDFTFAMSEKGAPITMHLEEFERVVHQLVHMKQLRKLLIALDLEDYVDVILSREIYTQFGRGAEIEAEIGKARQKRGDAESFVKSALEQIINALGNMARKPQTQVVQPSVFKPGPVRSRTSAAAAPAPAQAPAPVPVPNS